MTYERQEAAFDPIGNLLDAAERADFAAITSEGFEPGISVKEDCSDIDRAQAAHAKSTGHGTVTKKISIDYRWMEANLSGRDASYDNPVRKRYPHLAACDVAEVLYDNFRHYKRIHIVTISMSQDEQQEPGECRECDGAGRIEYYVDVDQTMAYACPVCEGKGKIR